MQVSARLWNWCFLVPKLFFDGKVHTNMSMTFIVRIGLVSVLLTAMGCTPAVVTPDAARLFAGSRFCRHTILAPPILPQPAPTAIFCVRFR